MDKTTVKKRGAPVKDMEEGDIKKQHSVSLSQNERDAIESVHGSLTKAILTLVPAKVK